MNGKTHNTEEIIRILRQADGGETAQSVCRRHNISEQTFYRWKKRYGDMELADAKRLKAVEKEVGRVDVGKSSAQRGQFKKVVSPSQKKIGCARCEGLALTLACLARRIAISRSR